MLFGKLSNGIIEWVCVCAVISPTTYNDKTTTIQNNILHVKERRKKWFLPGISARINFVYIVQRYNKKIDYSANCVVKQEKRVQYTNIDFDPHKPHSIDWFRKQQIKLGHLSKL